MPIDRATAPAVCRRPVTTEARVQSLATPCGIWNGQSGRWANISPSTLDFRCQYGSTSTPYSFINPSLLLKLEDGIE
jgi:hypothetical protein